MDIYEESTLFYQSAKTEKTVYGKSLFGRNLYAVKVGEGSPVGIAQYAMHGREWITAKLAFKQYEKGVAKGSCWFLPLTNPDGALLSQKGLSSVEKAEDKTFLISLNKGEDFSLWKANGRGVDLNVNFDAEWGKGVKNTRIAGAENYIGLCPFSEPETRSLQRFTKEIKPDYTLSYHTKGEEIYWQFKGNGNRRLAEILSDETGYKVMETYGSVGGYKDWCILQFGIPSFTVEVGKDSRSHPLNENALADILEKNEQAIYRLSGEI